MHKIELRISKDDIIAFNIYDIISSINKYYRISGVMFDGDFVILIFVDKNVVI